MIRFNLALAALLSTTAWGAPPSYSAAGIVNAGNYAPGPFAPNSLLSIFGSGLATTSKALEAEDIRGGYLPVELNFVRVVVDDSPAPLLYVSEGQINFLMPSRQATGKVKVRVVRNSFVGPEVYIQVVDAAPAVFAWGEYAIATDAANALLTSDSPARPGDVIVVYATGLGKTAPNPATGTIPRDPAQMTLLNDLEILLGGVRVDPARILYAGLTPGSAGLYQINLRLPDDLPADPSLLINVRTYGSCEGLKLPIRIAAPQLDGSPSR